MWIQAQAVADPKFKRVVSRILLFAEMAELKKNESASGSAFARYWNESARPLVSLIFVAPMIIAYEGGLLMLGPQAMRNGADVWLRRLLEWLGFSQYFLLPVLTCGILVGWHHLNRERWRFCWTVFYGMLLESMLFALLLLLLARVQGGLLSSTQIETLPTLAAQEVGALGQLIAFLGAGIYEELLFRLMLFPALAAVLRAAGAPPRTSWVLAIVLSSLVFAAAHYRVDLMLGSLHLQTSFGDTFDWMSFLFRFSAGVFFSMLFLARGFGVAAGTHAFYDILVSML